ncbi:anaphase-promoting complex component cut20 [Sporothrix brasiliensis 5110]|uniref:Anaphase-promoting complex subunit 4 n=1 Tax=Sporothrix brasiliensis 5110 TaxID=1398154 RepID=A0A0C2J250_9PEZI|nr:anaphase-promoting complex component cut20 [Sporothrix brasiliensis 5110]KIH93095.1 anaphase-promoting complex component cut20 [Sporothrix brasiliensis 5110]
MAGAVERLKLFNQSVFIPPADSPNLVAACPTIDLTAAVGGGNVVYIRRRGGEVVSKVTERNKDVQALAWRSDGQFLAVAWNDGVVRLAGLESSKAVHQIRLYESSPVAVTYISWAKNLVGGKETWQSGLLASQDDQQSSALLDLPRALMFLEVEDDIPKLPPLPVSGGTGDDMFVFSTRTSLEFMFRPLRPKDGDSIHIMLLGTVDGAIHVSIYDTFVMGTFKLPLPSSDGVATNENGPLLHLRRHTSHPASSTHTLLLANEEKDNKIVYISHMDFAFIHSSPLNLSLLAYKTTTFQKLMRYIRQTEDHMQIEWQSARELPARFLANIQEDLQGQRKRKNIAHALRVAAMTGYVPAVIKEWLVDTVAERGYRRWDKAVVGGLQNLRDLIHENMMPALDRAMLALSRLRGLAEFHSNDDIGFSADQIAELIDIVSCLILVTHNALALVTAELELFMCFSTWLRSLIERLALPAQAEEQADKEPNLSITPVIDYISNHLLRSPLDLHFGKPAEGEWRADWKAIQEQPKNGATISLLDQLEAEMERVDGFAVKPDFLAILQDGLREQRDSKGKQASETGQRSGSGKGHEVLDSHLGDRDREGKEEADDEDNGQPIKAFTQFGFLTRLFSTQSESVLKTIAESGRRHVHFGPLTRLSVGQPIEKAEVAMTAIAKPDPEDSADALSFTALSTKDDPKKIYLFRSTVATSEGVTTDVSTQGCVLDLAAGGRVVDFQFLGANLLLILWAATAEDRDSRLVVVPTQSPKITYGTYHGNGEELPPVPLAEIGLCWSAGVLAKGDNNSPVARMEVLGSRRSGSDHVSGVDSSATNSIIGDRSGSPARICLMHADGVTHQVLSLPSVEEMFGNDA